MARAINAAYTIDERDNDEEILEVDEDLEQSTNDAYLNRLRNMGLFSQKRQLQH